MNNKETLLGEAESRRGPAVCLLVPLFALACSEQPPAKAPGSDPGDMTPEGHGAAADAESKEAEAHENMAKDAAEGYGERAEVPEHKREADKHEEFSKQHESAADKATGGAPSK